MSTWHPQMVALRTSLGLPRHPIQIVATTRGLGFDGILFNVPDIPVVLLTIEQCSPLMAGQLARLTADEQQTLAQLLQRLAEENPADR